MARIGSRRLFPVLRWLFALAAVRALEFGICKFDFALCCCLRAIEFAWLPLLRVGWRSCFDLVLLVLVVRNFFFFLLILFAAPWCPTAGACPLRLRRGGLRPRRAANCRAISKFEKRWRGRCTGFFPSEIKISQFQRDACDGYVHAHVAPLR